MARAVSLTLFLLSWLLLFFYASSRERNEDIPSIECHVCSKAVDHIHQQVQNKEAQKCPKKEIKVFDHTDVADFLCKIQPVIDKLANRVCYELYPDACSVKTPSTKDGIPGQPLVPKPLNDAEMVNKGSKHKSKENNKLTITKETKKIKKRDPRSKINFWMPLILEGNKLFKSLESQENTSSEHLNKKQLRPL